MLPAPPREPCYAAWLFRPFVEVLNEEPGVAQALAGFPLARPELADPDERVPVTLAHEMLAAAVTGTDNPDLGLAAARRLRLGDAGVVDYLVASVATTRQGLDVAIRYMRLVNEALVVDLVTAGDRAVLELRNRVEMPRAATDFQLAGLYRTHLAAWAGNAANLIEVRLPYPEPARTEEHRRTFGAATLRFEASVAGFSMPASLLDLPVEKSDPRLHELLRRQAERLLAERPRTETVTDRVRALVSDELATGNPSASNVARRLAMSASTLARRLELEGTSFRDVVDAHRQRLALEYVANPEIQLAEVALLLGFSQLPAFYRAFRRWTGRTPIEYRRERRG
ncbi:MAG TPA: AraC family transcriptional regulator ligand-binding domain-containing protein [Polyangiaceae bacterium]|nr:AraC family transcriptional regulator ligand-binding domain-containing protein [Polyangiaceae bacterium]